MPDVRPLVLPVIVYVLKLAKCLDDVYVVTEIEGDVFGTLEEAEVEN
jgi:hypothetical protein